VRVPSSIREIITNDEDRMRWTAGGAEATVQTVMVPDTIFSSPDPRLRQSGAV